MESKILVLGSHVKSRQVDSFAWDLLPDELNVADYDVVILNLAAFDESETLRTSVQLHQLPESERFDRLIFSPSEVIAIGSLKTPLGSDDLWIRADWWLPLELVTKGETGDVRGAASGWEFYFDLVKTYSWYFDHLKTGMHTPRRDIRSVHPHANALAMTETPMAETRFGKAVSVALEFRAASVSRVQDPEFLTEWGRVYLLPTPTEVTTEEAIDSILSSRYSISAQERVPDWLGDFQLPNEGAPREKEAKARQAIEEHLAELSEAEADVAREGSFRKLLYETGEDGLEPVVREALRFLGAEVLDPGERGREDGRLEFGDAKAMLEIKGRRGSLKLSDVRELDQWVRDALVDWPSKGVLIGCLHNQDRPRDRKAPFPPNCVTLAERAGICLLTTSQLFEAVRRHQLGELDVEEFFSAVLGTSGVCLVPDLDDGEP